MICWICSEAGGCLGGCGENDNQQREIATGSNTETDEGLSRTEVPDNQLDLWEAQEWSAE